MPWTILRWNPVRIGQEQAKRPLSLLERIFHLRGKPGAFWGVMGWEQQPRAWFKSNLNERGVLPQAAQLIPTDS